MLDRIFQTPVKKVRYHSILFLLSLIIFLLFVIAGTKLGDAKITAWGPWIQAILTGMALAGTAYAIILQAKQGESVSWSIALSRLGELYDHAYRDDKLARLIIEPPNKSLNSAISFEELTLSPQETVWLGSLFLAYEQIYIATNSLSHESQRAWRLYLRNQLNKPTLRAAFVNDSTNSLDYHQDFWRFIRGTERKNYKDGAIDPVFFTTPKTASFRIDSSHNQLSSTVATFKDIEFWLQIYRDKEVKRQMYAAPTESPEILWTYISSRHAYTVWDKAQRIGVFSISKERDLLATFGIAIHPDFRGSGYGKDIIRLLTETALSLGIKTLRADVYEDNRACIKVLAADGFRKFIWMEKNL